MAMCEVCGSRCEERFCNWQCEAGYHKTMADDLRAEISRLRLEIESLKQHVHGCRNCNQMLSKEVEFCNSTCKDEYYHKTGGLTGQIRPPKFLVSDTGERYGWKQWAPDVRVSASSASVDITAVLGPMHWIDPRKGD